MSTIGDNLNLLSPFLGDQLIYKMRAGSMLKMYAFDSTSTIFWGEKNGYIERK